jgi:hypothetical protein
MVMYYANPEPHPAHFGLMQTPLQLKCFIHFFPAHFSNHIPSAMR